MSDTRKDKRAPVSLKVRFKSATVDEFIEQYAKDISHGGLFIKSKQPMAIGTLLKFEFQLKDESKLIQGVGRVVWKREAGDSDGEEKPAGMGIKFIKMDGESKTLVDQIVDGRQGTPGQYEAGAPAGALAGDEDGGSAPASKRPVRSQKATMQFFPSTTPMSELPKPEDRTQVRHASEFLASALASGGVDDLASKEADENAGEARKRTEEIEKEREAQAKAAREAEESAAREKAERERQEREKAEREEREAEAKAEEASASKKALEAAATAKATESPAKKSDAKKDDAKNDEPKAAAKSDAKTPSVRPKKDDAKKVSPVVEASPAPAGGGNMVVPIAIGLLLVLGGVGYYWMNQGPSAAEVVEGDPLLDDVVVGEPDAGEAAIVIVEEEDAGEPLPPAPTFEVRIETTPPGATLMVAGEEVGTSPATVALTEGAQTVTARLAGHRAGTGEVTVAEGAGPLRITLAALPYAIDITTTPPGARIRIGTRSGTSPGRVEITRPTAPVRVTASLSGFTDASSTLALDAFTETEEAMVATVNLALTARARTGGGSTGGGSTGGGSTTGGGTTGGGTDTDPEGGTTGGTTGGGTTGGGTTGGGTTGGGTTGGGTTGGGTTGGGTTGGGTTGGGTGGGGSTGGGSTGGGSTGGGSTGGGSTGGGSTGGGSTGGTTEEVPENPF